MRIPCPHPHERRHIIFICQHCHADLELTGRARDNAALYRCKLCGYVFAWTQAGWVQQWPEICEPAPVATDG